MKKVLILLLWFWIGAGTVRAEAGDRWFGYYWVDELIKDNQLAKISSYSNAAFVDNIWKSSDINTLAAMDAASLEKLNGQNMKGIVSLGSVFWDLSKQNSGKYPLRPDWESRFNSYWAKIYPYLGYVKAFYPFDEPDGNVDWGEFNSAVHLIKINVDSTGFKIPILLVVTPSGVLRIKSGELKVSDELGWLGFDEYNCWGSECFGGISIEEKLKVMSEKANQVSGRKVIVIPKGFSSTAEPTLEEQNELVLRLDQYYDLCTANSACNGLFIFMWDQMPNLNMYGVSALPKFETEAEVKGRMFLDRPLTSTPTPTAKCSLCVNGYDRSRGDANCDGSVNLTDFAQWTRDFITYNKSSQERSDYGADFNCDGKVTLADFAVWRQNFNK